jgi:peptidoglycan/xylan/chitin deacetylase (PgdA/CDA1 family)
MKPAPYGPFPYRPIAGRPPLSWPGGAKVALWVVPNIEFFALDEPVPEGTGRTPDVPTWSKRDYGNRVGVFRLMEVMDRHGIRGTVALNSHVCDNHPQIVEACCARGWELMGHCQTNTRRLNQIPPDMERAVIRATLDRIEAETGTRPKGWLGAGLQETWNTLDHLADEGVEYVCDWVNDDQPYAMDLGGGKRIAAIPYTVEAADKNCFTSLRYTAEAFERTLCRQFDVLYREGASSGRVMCIALHPYLIGVPHRIDSLDRALAYIVKHPGVWRATGSEIIAHARSAGAL